MDWVNLIDGLQLQYDKVTHHYIEPESAVKIFTLLVYGKGLLAFKRNTLQRQLVAQAFLISGFQQSRAKMAMHFYGSTDDFLRYMVLDSQDLLFEPSASLR